MFETLIGSVLGLVGRSMPELFRLFDRKNERAHELAMQDKALEFERLRGSSRMGELGHESEIAALQTLQSAYEAQGKSSGIRWIDALSASVRPMITYWFMALYCAVKMLGLYQAVRGGIPVTTAISMMWTAEDNAIWAGLINFWFLGRVFERRRGA